MRAHSPPLVSPEFSLLDDLLREVEQGRLRIPHVLSGFRWTPPQILKLLESMNKGYPIGSLVFWDTDAALPWSGRIGPLDMPSPPASGATSYVLDGQQRLSVLYGTLRLPSDFPNDARQEHWQWWVYYDLRERLFKHIPGGAREPQDMPVRALLKTVDFLREARWLDEKLGEGGAAPLLEEAESLAQRLKSYKIPVMHVHGGDLGDATEIFSRLNTRGQTISKEEMLSFQTHQESAPSVDPSRRGRRRRRH